MEENLVYIGEKNVSIYSRIIQQKLSQNREVVLKTRGKFIYNLVRIVSILQKENKVSIKRVEISGSDFQKEDKTYYVPSIEVILTKK